MNLHDESIRLQLYLARCGIGSRRFCEELILARRVAVNGAVADKLGTKVSPDDEVRFDGTIVRPEEKLRYVLLNKPAGFVCSMSDDRGRKTASSLLQPHFSERLYNVGRLDMFSSGLIIFTNDGDFAKRLSHPSSCIEKEYVVTTSIPVPKELAPRFEKGLRVGGVFYKCIKAECTSARTVRIVLTEGKNREIRRVFEYFETGIRSLERVRIGNIFIEDLKAGDFKELTEDQVRSLRTLIKGQGE